MTTTAAIAATIQTAQTAGQSPVAGGALDALFAPAATGAAGANQSGANPAGFAAALLTALGGAQPGQAGQVAQPVAAGLLAAANGNTTPAILAAGPAGAEIVQAKAANGAQTTHSAVHAAVAADAALQPAAAILIQTGPVAAQPDKAGLVPIASKASDAATAAPADDNAAPSPQVQLLAGLFIGPLPVQPQTKAAAPDASNDDGGAIGASTPPKSATLAASGAFLLVGADAAPQNPKVALKANNQASEAAEPASAAVVTETAAPAGPQTPTVELTASASISPPAPAPVQALAEQLAGVQASIQGRVINEPAVKPANGRDRAVGATSRDPAPAAAVQTSAGPAAILSADPAASPSNVLASAQDDHPETQVLAAGDLAPETRAASEASGQAQQAASGAPALAGDPQLAQQPLATAQTVTQLAAYMANQAAPAKATRFQVSLDPAGLGKVDVRLEISSGGQLTAAMTFQNAHSAQELSARSSELQSALQQAGFDVSKNALTFTSGDPSGQGLLQQQQQQQQQQQRQGDGPALRTPAFHNLADNSDTAPALATRQTRAGGVDVTI